MGALNSEIMLEVADLRYRIGGKAILAGLSFAVRQGEYVSIIGPNGAGKTTLLRCMNRILPGYEGSIRVCGRDVRRHRPAELARLLGYVPQADGRGFPFTVHDFVMMGRYPHLSPFSSVGPEDEAAVRRALTLTNTEAFADRIQSTLSGGEKQKVLIAAALAQDARILLLDEPTTFLDPHHQADIFAILKRVNEEARATILSVTHDVNAAALASSRVLALKAGRCVYDGRPGEVMDNRVLGQLYGKEFLFAKHPVTGMPLLVPEGTGHGKA
jgi:iron complex transport system ATP-binding protein